jgi:hypothetical protein
MLTQVSLVGQWVQEARNKLKDASKIVEYHGSNRIRDVDTLSRFHIVRALSPPAVSVMAGVSEGCKCDINAHVQVVTTYETLASDFNGRTKKAKGDINPGMSTILGLQPRRLPCHAVKQRLSRPHAANAAAMQFQKSTGGD